VREAGIVCLEMIVVDDSPTCSTYGAVRGRRLKGLCRICIFVS
jgi:hypothetical protein